MLADHTLGSYTACLPTKDGQNWQAKTFVNTKFVAMAGVDPHHFLYKDGRFAVNSLMQRQDRGITTTFTEQHAVIYHYVTKSLEEFHAKMQRGSGMNKPGHRGMAFFDEMNQKSTDICLLPPST